MVGIEKGVNAERKEKLQIIWWEGSIHISPGTEEERNFLEGMLDIFDRDIVDYLGKGRSCRDRAAIKGSNKNNVVRIANILKCGSDP